MKKLLFLSMFIVFFAGCASFQKPEDKIAKFEQKLTANVGKMTQDVKKEYGKPTRYSNQSPLDANETGGFMIYDERQAESDNSSCVLVFKYSKKTLKILDWGYSGDCFDR